MMSSFCRARGGGELVSVAVPSASITSSASASLELNLCVTEQSADSTSMVRRRATVTDGRPVHELAGGSGRHAVGTSWTAAQAYQLALGGVVPNVVAVVDADDSRCAAFAPDAGGVVLICQGRGGRGGPEAARLAAPNQNCPSLWSVPGRTSDLVRANEPRRPDADRRPDRKVAAACSFSWLSSWPLPLPREARRWTSKPGPTPTRLRRVAPVPRTLPSRPADGGCPSRERRCQVRPIGGLPVHGDVNGAE